MPRPLPPSAPYIATHLSQKTAKELFDYDKTTGVLTWRVNHAGRARAGQPVGTPQRAYKGDEKPESFRVIVNNQRWRLSRLIWLWMTGDLPPGPLAFYDGDPSNMRWANIKLKDDVVGLSNSRAAIYQRELRLRRKAREKYFTALTPETPDHPLSEHWMRDEWAEKIRQEKLRKKLRQP